MHDKFTQQSKVTFRKTKKTIVRKIMNTATRNTNKSATKHATSIRGSTNGKNDEDVSAKKGKTSKHGKRRNVPATSTSFRNSNTSQDDVKVLKKEASLEKEIVDKKSNDVKLSLLDVKLKKKEKNKARRKKKRQQNWSIMGANEKVQKDNKDEELDPHKKQKTLMKNKGTAAATTNYSSTDKKVKNAKKDVKKGKKIFEMKNYAEKLKKKYEKILLAKKLKTSLQSNGMQDELFSPNDRKGKTSLEEKSRVTTATTCVSNTKDNLKEVKKKVKRNKEFCVKKIDLENEMHKKREKKKGKRKIQQQKWASNRYIGRKSSHFEEEAFTKNKRSERAIEKFKKRQRG